MRYKKIVVMIVALALMVGLSLCPMSAFAKNIVKGDSSQNIKMAQQRLSDLGYYKLKVDGVWGAKTTLAVKNFQRDNGLTADGIIGASTEKALKIQLSGSSSGASSINSSDLNLLSRCVYSEARGEPYTGQVAVAAVVLNRVKSSKFPNSISGVIYQPLAFTAVADGQINLSPNEAAIKAAKDALSGYDPTNGCLYYYNPATATSKWIWSLTVELKIGKHSFARA